MKKIKLFSFTAIVLLLSGILIFSCKKSSTEDPNLTYIKNFYGVNKVHSFICANPNNDTKSLKIDLVWDKNGVATYTVTDIQKDSTEHNSRIFMPSSEFDAKTGALKATKNVKTIMLEFIDGNLEPVDNLNCVNGYWGCKTCGGQFPYVVTTTTGQWVMCTSTCAAEWHCNGVGIGYPVAIGYQTE